MSRVRGGSKLRRQLRQLGPATYTELTKEMDAIGQEFATEVHDRAPKDQGDLSEAVIYQVSRDGLGVAIGYSAKRSGFKRAWKRGGFEALFQEFGTRHHAAQPFIRPAWRAKVKSALTRIDMARANALKKALRQ